MPRCSACGKKNLPGFTFCQKCGAPLEGVEDEVPEAAAQRERRAAAGATGEAEAFEEQIALLLEQGDKIEAIKLYRQRTGAGLTEAKRAVEQMQVDVIFGESDIAEQLLASLRQGRKIEAIKIYRQRTRSGLKEAKEAVEALATKHGLETRRAGCASMFLLWLAVAGGTLALLATWDRFSTGHISSGPGLQRSARPVGAYDV